MKIYKVTQYFSQGTPEGGKWGFYPGETLTPEQVATRGLAAEGIQYRLDLGHLEEIEAEDPPSLPLTADTTTQELLEGAMAQAQQAGDGEPADAEEPFDPANASPQGAGDASDWKDPPEGVSEDPEAEKAS